MSTDRANPDQPATGRDNKGRFTVGNIGGPGNPFARKIASLRQALVDSVTHKRTFARRDHERRPLGSGPPCSVV